MQNAMTVQVGQAHPVFIRVTRRIKTTMPAIASIWAILFEPVLSVLRAAMGASPSRCLAFADDIGLTLSQYIPDQLLRLRSFCRILEPAVSLSIDGANTKVVAMAGGARTAALRGEARIRGPPLSSMQVVTTAR